MKCSFKLDYPLELSSIREFIDDNSTMFNSMAEKIWARMVAIDACRLFDHDEYYGKLKTKQNHIATAYDSLCKDLFAAYEKKIRTQIDVEVQLFFQKSNIDSKIYGLYIINNDELLNVFLSLESITPLDADSNANIWDDIFNKHKTPTTAMLSTNLVQCGAVELSVESIMDEIPTTNERAQFLAESIAIEDFRNNGTSQHNSMEDIWSYLNSDDYAKEIKILNGKIKKKINTTITLKHITG